MRKPKKQSKLGSFKEIELLDHKDAPNRCIEVCEKITEQLLAKSGM